VTTAGGLERGISISESMDLWSFDPGQDCFPYSDRTKPPAKEKNGISKSILGNLNNSYCALEVELVLNASLCNYRKVYSEIGCLEEDIPGGCKVKQIVYWGRGGWGKEAG